MGFPVVQLVLIAMRQVSKPVADSVMRYGKDHPFFRKKILIPIGKNMLRLTQRLKMKNYNLGAAPPSPPISEAAALESAMEVVQQFVVFSYSCSVFVGYYWYMWYTSEPASESVKMEQYLKETGERDKIIAEISERLRLLEEGRNAKTPANKATESAEQSAKYYRLSSLPVDEAQQILVKDDKGYDVEYLVVRRGNSIGIELMSMFKHRGEPLTFRPKPIPSTRHSRFHEAAVHLVRDILGWSL